MKEQYTAQHQPGEGNRRADAFFDAGTFVEIGAHLRRNRDDAEFEGVVCGYGAVNGKLVFAFFQDNSRMKGALDALYSRKIENLYALAIKNGAPVVGVFDSAGAVIYDGASSMAAYGSLMKCAAKASGVIPQIAVIDGICAGSAATVAAMFDFVITASDRAEFYVLPAYTSDKTETDPVVACREPDEAAAFGKAHALLSFLPSNNAEGTVVFEAEDDPNRAFVWNPEAFSASLSQLADLGNAVELYEGTGDLYTGFMQIGNMAVGVVAGNGGGLGMAEARKVTKLVSFCDSFSIPVVTLVDCIGVKNTDHAPALASELARLAQTYAVAECPLVTVVTGKAYGAGFTLLGSKALGADMVYALPDASISLLSPEASAAFVWNNRVTDTVSRESVEEEWKAQYASPAEAACRGEVDDVIEPEEFRARIAAALSMLVTKASGDPGRRHVVAPL